MQIFSKYNPHVLLFFKELRWCIGFNAEVPVLNLSTNNKFEILFANSQFSVLYDFHEEKMRFLQGHVSKIQTILLLLVVFQQNKVIRVGPS